MNKYIDKEVVWRKTLWKARRLVEEEVLGLWINFYEKHLAQQQLL